MDLELLSLEKPLMSIFMSSFAFFFGLCSVGPLAVNRNAPLQKWFTETKAETTISLVIFSNFRKPFFFCNCYRHLLIHQNHFKTVISALPTQQATNYTLYFVHILLCMSFTVSEFVWLFWEQLASGPPNCASLERNGSPRMTKAWLAKSSRMSGFCPSTSHTHWKSYIVSIVNLKFLNGACLRDEFSLESSYLE